MDLRHVTVYLHKLSPQKPLGRTVTVALEGVGTQDRRELLDRGFSPDGDSVAIRIEGDDVNRVHLILRDLEQWIITWAEKQGATPVFKWRVIPP